MSGNSGALSAAEKYGNGRRPSGFVDVHCHCLPGLDDGPSDMEQALSLCRALTADGIVEVVATPHQLGRFDGHCDAPGVRRAVAQLNRVLHRNGIRLAVFPGADIRIDERIPQLLRADRILTLADAGRYLLVELPHEVFIDPRGLLEQLTQTRMAAVMTHPERHGFLASNPQYVDRWAEHRMCLQITAGSLLGDFGRQCEQAAWSFLHTSLPAVVATDAHNVGDRPPRMTAAYQRLVQRLGRSAAETLCVDNPRRLLAGQELMLLGEVLQGERR